MTKKLKKAYPSPKMTTEEKSQLKKEQQQIKEEQQSNEEFDISEKKCVKILLKKIEKDKINMVDIKSEMENIRTAYKICKNYIIKKEYRVLIIEKEKELRIMCKNHHGHLSFDLDVFPVWSHRDEYTYLCTICGL